MKNKYLSIVLLITVVLLSTGCSSNTTVIKINNSTETSDNTFAEEEELSRDEYVDTEISKITDSEEYKESSYDDRKAAIEQILTKLKEEKYIKNDYYDKDSQMFTFQYSSGVLGGAMIKEFDSLMN